MKKPVYQENVNDFLAILVLEVVDVETVDGFSGVAEHARKGHFARTSDIRLECSCARVDLGQHVTIVAPKLRVDRHQAREPAILREKIVDQVFGRFS